MTEAPTSAAGRDFIRDLIDRDRAAGRHGGRVATRFPPEPNGYLHIGHAKSICLNFGLAQEYGGTCNLRLDDTNPETEDQEFVIAIQDGVRWLGFDWGQNFFRASDYFERFYDLAVALNSARSGDTNLLTSLINRAQATTGTDGQFVNSCSDAVNRPTPDRIRELVVAWAKLYPEFGTVGALNLVKCVSWPTTQPPQPPKILKVNVLLMGVQSDPIVGEEGVSATAATIINATAASKRVMWQGIGHGASVYSSCAVPPLVGYLDSGNLPATDTYCPA